MAQFLRPNADISVGGWGTTPLWSKLSESTPDDATTQIRSAKNPASDTFEVGLSAPAGMPADRLNHVLRVRISSGGNSGYTATVTLLQGSSTIESFSGQSIPTAYGTLTLNVSQASAQSITDYSQLRVRVGANGGGGGRAYCTWIELQLPDPAVAKSGSAFVSGKGTVAGAIRKTALAQAILSAAGGVAAAGGKVFLAFVSGGGAVAASAQKTSHGTATISGGDSGFAGALSGRKATAGTAALSGGGAVTVLSGESSWSFSIIVSGGGTVATVGRKGGVLCSGYFDDFNRPDESPLGMPWSDAHLLTGQGLYETQKLEGNAVTNQAVYSRRAGSFHTGAFPTDHDSKVVAKPNSYVGVLLRGSYGHGYVVLVAGACGHGTHARIQITRHQLDSPYLVFIDDFDSYRPDWVSPGHILRAVVKGTDPVVIETYLDGERVRVSTDSTAGKIISGKPGIVTLTPYHYVDDWESRYGFGCSCSGAGTVVAAGRKSGAAAVQILGDGTLSATASRNPLVPVLLSGGGNVYASSREEAYRAVSLSGGGAVSILAGKGGKGRSRVSGRGTVVLAGRKGAHAQPAISGGGNVAASIDVVAGTFVWGLIRGGGDLIASGTKAARAPPVVSGAGKASVRGVRSWPAIALTPAADTDSTALLVLLTLDDCGETFGVPPCLGTGAPCYNTWRTCKYIWAYRNVGRTYRFCSAEFPQVLPDARPYVASVRWMPTEIKTNLTVNARVTVEMADEPDADVGIDPYWAQRPDHPGTFWKKLLARNANYRGRTLRIFEGRPGAPESTYTLRWIGKLDNITVKGAKVSIESVDLLKDLAKIEVPPKVNAKLAADVAIDYTLGLSLTEDADKFPASGYVRIDDEIIRYESKDDTTKQLSTLFRAQFGTVAAAHQAKTKVQPVRYFPPRSGFEHLLDMLLVDAGIDPEYVDADAFTSWKEWPAKDIDFAAVVSEPKKLSDLFFEVVDLLDCKAWVAENLKITIRRNVPNAPGRTYHVLSDEDDIVLGSASADLNEASRITRVSIYWDKIATAKDGESTSYRRLDVAVDPDAEENYDGVIEKTILCRWIDPTCGEEGMIGRFVQNLGLRRITRQRDAQPLLFVELPPKDAHVLTGDYMRLSTDEIVDPDGNPIARRIFQVVKRERKKERYALTLLQVAQRRVCFIAPAGLADCESATEGEKEYGFITGADGKMSDGSEGYYIW